MVMLVSLELQRSSCSCNNIRFRGSRFLWGWNRRGPRRNCAYAEQQQQREYRGVGRGDEVGVAAEERLRPVWGTDVPFRPREKGVAYTDSLG